MWLLIALALTLVVGCSRAPSPAPKESPAEKAEDWSLATASSGSNPYVLGGMFAQVVNAHQKKVRLSAQVTPGWIKNVPLVDSGEMQLGQITVSDLNDAYEGKGMFDRKYENLRGLFVYGTEPLAIVTLDRSNIETVSDLKGKKVHIGSPGSATANCSKIVLQAHGLALTDIQVFQFTTGQAIDALRDGQIAAAFIFGVPPISGLQELSYSNKIKLVPIQEEYQKKIFDVTQGALGISVIKAGSYRGVDQDVPTVAFKAALMANKDVSEEGVYQITKALWEHLDELETMHHGIKGEYGMRLEKAVEGINVPLHPGAQKYFKEAGALK